jgi:hypothetical protein
VPDDVAHGDVRRDHSVDRSHSASGSSDDRHARRAMMRALPLRAIALALLAIGIAAGTIADRPQTTPPLIVGGYRVLAADFHVHSATWSDGALTPWGLVLEASRQGLDAISINGHQQVSDGKVARWFAERIGGVTVLIGQEIVTPDHHVVAVGIDRVVDAELSVEGQIADIHRQGGVAIAAHPFPSFWPAYPKPVRQQLDGAEVCHPIIFGREDARQQLAEFRDGFPNLAPIGSSDFHGSGRLGICRTYVFARDASAPAILDALRARRTVVFTPGGHAHGDPALVRLLEPYPQLRDIATLDPSASALDWISRICGVLGLLGFVLAASRKP